MAWAEQFAGGGGELFAEDSLELRFHERQAAIGTQVEAIPADQLEASSDDDLVSHLEALLRVEPIMLREEARSTAQREIRVDVAGDIKRGFMRTGAGPFYVPGVRTEITIPFIGESWILQYQPSPPVTERLKGEITARGRTQGALTIVVEWPTDAGLKAFADVYDQVIVIAALKLIFDNDLTPRLVFCNQVTSE